MTSPSPAAAHNAAPPVAPAHEPATVYFMPTRNFTASTDGIEPALYVAGKDDNGDPLVYPVPRHQALDWEKRYGWGQIVDVRRVVKGTPLPAVPPTRPGEASEVIVGPSMVDPALKAAHATAEATAQAVQAAQSNSPAGPAGTEAPASDPSPRVDANAKAGTGAAKTAPGKQPSKSGAKK